MYITIVIIIVAAMMMIAFGDDDNLAMRFFGMLLLMFASSVFGAVLIDDAAKIESLKEGRHLFKVRELEQNTVFTIKDSTNLLQPNDSVWVNMTTRRVDPIDSVAMKCVVLERVKGDSQHQ